MPGSAQGKPSSVGPRLALCQRPDIETGCRLGLACSKCMTGGLPALAPRNKQTLGQLTKKSTARLVMFVPSQGRGYGRESHPPRWNTICASGAQTLMHAAVWAAPPGARHESIIGATRSAQSQPKRRSEPLVSCRQLPPHDTRSVREQLGLARTSTNTPSLRPVPRATMRSHTELCTIFDWPKARKGKARFTQHGASPPVHQQSGS